MTRPAVAPIASVPPPVASPPDSAQDVKHSGATTLAAKHVKAPGSGATAPLDGGSSHGAGTHGAGAGGGGSGSSYEHDKSKEKGKKSA